MAVGDAHVFPGFPTPVLIQLSFQSHRLLTCFCRGVRRKFTGKKVCLDRESNSQPPGPESDTLTMEPPRQGRKLTATTYPTHIHPVKGKIKCNKALCTTTVLRNLTLSHTSLGFCVCRTSLLKTL